MELGLNSKDLSNSASFAGNWILIFTILVTTIIITTYTSLKRSEEDHLRFNYETDMILQIVENRMNNYESALIEARAFVKNSKKFSRKELELFIQDTEVFSRLPGLQGLGYSIMIKKEQKNQFEKAMRKDFGTFKIWPKGFREIYSSIIVLEPQDWRNQTAMGFDMYNESTRKKAMDQATEENRAILSEKVFLVQGGERAELNGFLLFLPHYKKDAKLVTVTDRKNALLGFTYSPLRASELFGALFSEFKMMVNVSIYSQNEDTSNHYYTFSQNGYKPVLSSVKKLNLHGREWIFKFSDLPQFPRSSSSLKDFMVFTTGCLISILIYVIFHITRRQMHLAHALAIEKEKLLQREKEHVQTRDDFLSIASHELKTPLTSLKLHAQIMQRAIERKDTNQFKPEKISALVHQVDEQTNRLTRLVDDMLDISRIRSGKLRIEKGLVDLNELIMDVIDKLKPQFMNSIHELPKTIFKSNIKGHWDRFRIEQVLNNLLTNAIKYGNKKPIIIKTLQENNKAKIQVIDQGIGIAPGNLEKIFERFERAGMTAREISGLGLGLYITNQIIKAHGGKITVKSIPEKGSTFTVELPL